MAGTTTTTPPGLIEARLARSLAERMVRAGFPAADLERVGDVVHFGQAHLAAVLRVLHLRAEGPASAAEADAAVRTAELARLAARRAAVRIGLLPSSLTDRATGRIGTADLDVARWLDPSAELRDAETAATVARLQERDRALLERFHLAGMPEGLLAPLREHFQGLYPLAGAGVPVQDVAALRLSALQDIVAKLSAALARPTGAEVVDVSLASAMARAAADEVAVSAAEATT